MEEQIFFELNSVYRDNMRIKGYTFGKGEKSACIVGATRGNEVQQVYICSRLINILGQLEIQNKIKNGRSVTIVPCVNPRQTFLVNRQYRYQQNVSRI